MNFKVTLRATRPTGIFYWVSDVIADSEESAVALAESGFFEEIESGQDWAFDAFDAELLEDSPAES